MVTMQNVLIDLFHHNSRNHGGRDDESTVVIRVSALLRNIACLIIRFAMLIASMFSTVAVLVLRPSSQLLLSLNRGRNNFIQEEEDEDGNDP